MTPCDIFPQWQYNSFLACWEEFIPPPFEPKLDALKVCWSLVWRLKKLNCFLSFVSIFIFHHCFSTFLCCSSSTFFSVPSSAVSFFHPGFFHAASLCYKGLALVTEDGPVKNIVLFDVSELSALPKERFGTLFAQRRAWTLTDISPYIK